MTGCNLRTFTAEEKSFAENNLNLVYKYLNIHGLDSEEFFDVVIFGYLQAIQQYHERPELHQYTFSTMAFQYMSHAIQHHNRRNTAKKRQSGTENLRLDSPCSNEESSADLHEVIADSDSDFAEDVVSALYWQRIICRMPEGDQKIIKRLVDGMTVGEIAKEDKISRQAVHRKLQRIRSRLQTRV